MRPIADVAHELGIHPDDVLPYGRDKAKIALEALTRPRSGRGDLVLVSAINPTPAGEGKTTTAIGLAMGLRRRGTRVALALREPSLGPVFGQKGGATGGGRATVEPAGAINLHFTGDLHAITAAHNLLAAMVDNAIHWQDPAAPDPRRITWGRAIDMNDRALRRVVTGLGGASEGVPREARFDITAASEVMAILCLAESVADLEARLARIVVGTRRDGTPVTAGDLGAAGAMTALLRDALQPNLVQTAEGGPALVHGGPFANIAHGCSSVLATRMGLHHADVVVTEAGFGMDLGGEKFLDLKCRIAGLWPRVTVLVVTLRALRMHGGLSATAAASPDAAALARGFEHLEHHLAAIAAFGLPAVVAINRHGADPESELAAVEAFCAARGVVAARCEGFAAGGEGAVALADAVTPFLGGPALEPQFTYPDDWSILDKLRAVARRSYGADDVVLTPAAARQAATLEAQGAGRLPVCVAKTPASLSDDPTRAGRPRGFVVTVRELRWSAGAGFVVALSGDIMTMPGLPREPAARRVRILPDGRATGLMQGD